MQAVDELTLEVAARYAWADQPLARRPGANAPVIGPRHSLTAMPRYLNNRAGSIYGGSNEIQRNIMARQMLGL
jgi:acyl-CoA dehydrogenase